MSQTLELEAKEKAELTALFSQLDVKLMKSTFQAISMMVRAFNGQSVDDDDVITRLTNVKNLLERSRFPTYPLIAKQVYLRLIQQYHPEAASCQQWADYEAEALISYKGLSREEYTEQMKAASAGEQQQVFMGQLGQPRQPEAKRRFWQRGESKEKSEFVNQ